MAAGDVIYTLKDAAGVAHPTTPTTQATHARIDPTGSGHAVNPATRESVVTAPRVVVQVFGANLGELKALVGAAAANLILNTIGAAGAGENHTLKSVTFRRFLSPAEVNRLDFAGETPPFGIEGECEVAATDTMALLWTAAADGE